MYYCKTCESIFDRPETEWIDDEHEYAEVCPYCGDTDFALMRDERDM